MSTLLFAELTKPEFEKAVEGCLGELADQEGQLSERALANFLHLAELSSQSELLTLFLKKLSRTEGLAPENLQQLALTGFWIGWQARTMIQESRERVI